MGFTTSFARTALFSALLTLSYSLSLDPSLEFDLFDSWCKLHGKKYPTEQEKLHRFRVFQDNLAYVNQHNSLPNSTYSLALNAFADLTLHEFRATKLGLSASIVSVTENPHQERDYGVVDIPSEIDWRKKGAVTSVKNQGGCGDCWAFSATGAIEGINKIITGTLVSLSEQELCDCDTTYNSGCGGGLMDYAFKWIIQNHGIDTEEDYPYKGAQGTCHKDKLKRHIVTIDGYSDVPANNERQLLQAVATQPVSVGICGSERAFQLYSKGIFSSPCSTSLDHAVLIVGYGSENGIDYWIVKNSWGKSWGMSGYIHMLRNSGEAEGICGINKLASYPIKTSPNPPAPPPPGPVKCDLLTHCPAGNTCCCTRHFLGFCLSWSCCGMQSAVCCQDRRYCCPHDYPVCESSTKQCLKGSGNATLMEVLEKRSFGRLSVWDSFF